MTDPIAASPPRVAERLAPSSEGGFDGLTGVASLSETTEKRMDEIEMVGDEVAAGFHRSNRSAVSADARFLHASRTIHELVSDRNRAVGIYLAVASLLWTASSAILNAKPAADLIVPIESVQSVCLPATFGTLALLALFVGFLLIRTRIGLIYEVAKMNLLLGLPVGRVRRVNPLSIFFIMHLLISVAGGCTAGVFMYFMLVYAEVLEHATIYAIACGIAVTIVLVLLYVGTVLYTTSDKRLQGA